MTQYQSHHRRISIGFAALGLLAVCVAARADWRVSYGLDPIEDLENIQTQVTDGTLGRRLAFLTLAAVGTWGLVRPGPSRLRVRGALGSCLVALTAWCLASAAWSIEPSLTLRRMFTLGATIVFAVALAKQLSSRDVLRLACAYAGLQLALDIAVAAALGNFRPWEAGYRFAGLLHPNHEAVNCALLFFSSITLGRRAASAKGAYRMLAAMAFVMLFLTKSRTALLSCLMGYLLYRLQAVGRSTRVLAVSAAICTVCAAVLFLGGLVGDGLTSGVTMDRTDSDVSTLTGRVPLWEELIGYVAAEPLAGYGYGGFWSPNRVLAMFETQNWPVSHAHSDYIELALSLGLVGLLLYVSAIVLTLRLSRAAHRENDRAGHDGISALICFVVFSGGAEGVGLTFSMLQIIVISAMARAGLTVSASSDESAKAEDDLAGMPIVGAWPDTAVRGAAT